ncbi:MAG: methyltransferase domain-containing protein, partial [Deltaproteobacteria bacterium]|nr:methyltransferase domain-containing protein [Deltaproteobacteria bacterium]
ALKNIQPKPPRLVGLDISWSRLYVGEKHAQESEVQIERSVVGNLFRLPFLDDSFDIVYTHACIEQSPTDNQRALSELYRVAKNYLILMEPSYELGDSIQQKRILSQDYVRGLPKTIDQLGYRLVKYELLPVGAYANCSAVFIIEKDKNRTDELNSDYLACPNSKAPLIMEKGHLYCKKLGLIYPVIHGIPCLEESSAIRGSKFLD